MSSQWIETWGSIYLGYPCGCGKPAVYVRYYPDWLPGGWPKYLCQGCKQAQDMALRDLVAKAQELTEKEAGA